MADDTSLFSVADDINESTPKLTNDHNPSSVFSTPLSCQALILKNIFKPHIKHQIPIPAKTLLQPPFPNHIF